MITIINLSRSYGNFLYNILTEQLNILRQLVQQEQQQQWSFVV